MSRRYIPSAVFKQIESGTLPYVNEMRKISVMFINGSGLDAAWRPLLRASESEVMSKDGPKQAQELMSSVRGLHIDSGVHSLPSQVQKVCYSHEGTLNKFLIDDKGMSGP